MLQGLIIGLVGTMAGAIGGCALSYVLDRYKLIHVPIDVYQISLRAVHARSRSTSRS